MAKLTVIKDTREKSGWQFRETETCGGLLVQKLDTGDYSLVGLEDRFVVERKGAISEFATNLVDDRFHRELARLAEFPHPFIFLEFYMFNLLEFPVGANIPRNMIGKIKLNGKVLCKKLTEINLKYPHIQVVFCGDTVAAQTYFWSLSKRLYEQYSSD